MAYISSENSNLKNRTFCNICDTCEYKKAYQNNPKIDNYDIIELYEFNNIRCIIVAIIKYKDCTNYEGVKILIFEKISKEELLKLKLIDPHFMDDRKNKLLARFNPDCLNVALSFAELYSNNLFVQKGFLECEVLPEQKDTFIEIKCCNCNEYFMVEL